MLCGELEQLKDGLKASGLSGKINTAFIERLNLTLRQGVSFLTRRTWGTGAIYARIRSLPGLVARLLPFRQISRKSQGEIGSAVGAQRETNSQKISQTDTGYGGWVHHSPMDGVRIAFFSTPLKENGNRGLKDK